MDGTTTEELTDQDIRTVMPGAASVKAETETGGMPGDGDGTDGDATDGTDGDATDSDTKDADGTDTQDAGGDTDTTDGGS